MAELGRPDRAVDTVGAAGSTVPGRGIGTVGDAGDGDGDEGVSVAPAQQAENVGGRRSRCRPLRPGRS